MEYIVGIVGISSDVYKKRGQSWYILEATD